MRIDKDRCALDLRGPAGHQPIPNSAGVRVFSVVRPQQVPLEGAFQRGIDFFNGFAHRVLGEARTTKRIRMIGQPCKRHSASMLLDAQSYAL